MNLKLTFDVEVVQTTGPECEPEDIAQAIVAGFEEGEIAGSPSFVFLPSDGEEATFQVDFTVREPSRACMS